MRLVCCVACRSPVSFRPSSPTCQPDGTCVFPRPAKTSFAGERGFVNLSGRTLRSIPGEQHWKHRRHLPAPSEGCRPVERTFAAGSFVAMDSVVASPAAVAGSRERPRGRATQTALSVASAGTAPSPRAFDSVTWYIRNVLFSHAVCPAVLQHGRVPDRSGLRSACAWLCPGWCTPGGTPPSSSSSSCTAWRGPLLQLALWEPGLGEVTTGQEKDCCQPP